MHHTVPAAGMQISPEMLKSVSSMMSSMSPEMMQSMLSMASSSGTATGAAPPPGAPAASGQQTAPGRFSVATKRKKGKKDYAFRRQFNEKPSIIPGCPGLCCHISWAMLSLLVACITCKKVKSRHTEHH